MECEKCKKTHLLNDCPLNDLPFRDDKVKYIPTKDEYENYINYLKTKNFTQKELNADIGHYRSFFSKKFHNIYDVFPYAQKAMHKYFPDYSGNIVGTKIQWKRM